MSNVTLLPSAAAPPVINRRRGRLPSSVAKLGRARALRSNATDSPAAERRYQTYHDRRQAAVECVMQSADGDLFEQLDQLHMDLAIITRKIWAMQDTLLYRFDPGLEAAGKAKGGQA